VTVAKRRYRALLVDVGGVITTDFYASIAAHCERLGLPRDAFVRLVTEDPEGRSLYHCLERGEVSQRDFERQFAALLGVGPDGLVRGLLADLRPNQEILDAVAQLRARGVRVGVISNSWGMEPYDPYQPFDLPTHFDAVVISGEVGIRKPDPEIYRLAAEKLGVPAEECVFVDDLAGNLPAAQDVGMTAIHHQDASQTLRALQELFDAGQPSDQHMDQAQDFGSGAW
jgi:putative hydrolase of the HAD superfamily